MNLFYELLQVSIGTRDYLSRVPSDLEWNELFQISKKQTLVGVCFSGIEKLSKEFWPSKQELLKWITYVNAIENQNCLLDVVSAEVLKMFDADGFKGCILKGQGNAQMYPNSRRRQPGDVDVWLIPNTLFLKKERTSSFFRMCRKNIIKYVRGRYPDVKVQLHHIEYPPVRHVEVEVHFYPIFLKNPFHNQRLQQFFAENIEEQFMNRVETSSGQELVVPTITFNAVYQLVHVYLHFLFQGVGLRHIVDYYYVISQLTNESEKLRVSSTLNDLGLKTFVGAMMWVMKSLCGVPDEVLISEPNEKQGRLLLDEMLAMGNFGKHDKLYWKGQKSGLYYWFQKLRRLIKLSKTYYKEIFWDPYFRVRLFYAEKFNI